MIKKEKLGGEKSLRKTKAVECLLEECNEVLCSMLSCLDLEPLSESVHVQAKVVAYYGRIVRADELEGVFWCDGCYGIFL